MSYYIYTFDIDINDFTPQIGVHPGPYQTLWAMRSAIRELRSMGFDDCSILVTKFKHDEPTPKKEPEDRPMQSMVDVRRETARRIFEEVEEGTLFDG